MTASRPTSLLAALALVTSGLAAVAGVTASPANALDPGYRWCSKPTAPPCVEHLYVDGVEKFDGDADWNVHFAFFGGGVSPSAMFQFYVHKDGGYNLLDSTERFKVVLDTGTLVPRVVDGWASAAVVSRNPDPAGLHNHVTVAAEPSEHLGACTDVAGTLTCPDTAAADDSDVNQVAVTIDNGAWWGEARQVNGLEYFSNVDVGGIPPDFNAGTLTFLLANAHRRFDTTVYVGRAELRLPNGFVREVWGVPDPATMTSTSLAATLGSGTGNVNIYQESGADAMRIDLSGVTFSKRRLQVTLGNIKPTRPSITKTKRVTGAKGRVTFTNSRPRGAKVLGYTARCVSGRHVVIAQGSYPTVVVKGLKRGRAYDCKVRAKSKAGPSRYSKVKRLPK